MNVPLTFDVFLSEIEAVDGIEAKARLSRIVTCAERFGYVTSFHRTKGDKRACMLGWQGTPVFDLQSSKGVWIVISTIEAHNIYSVDPIVGPLLAKAVSRDPRKVKWTAVPITTDEAFDDVLFLLGAFAAFLSKGER